MTGGKVYALTKGPFHTGTKIRQYLEKASAAAH